MWGRGWTCSGQRRGVEGRGDACTNRTPIKNAATQCATAVEAGPAHTVFGGAGASSRSRAARQRSRRRESVARATQLAFCTRRRRGGTENMGGRVCVLVQKMSPLAQPARVLIVGVQGTRLSAGYALLSELLRHQRSFPARSFPETLRTYAWSSHCLGSWSSTRICRWCCTGRGRSICWGNWPRPRPRSRQG